MKCGEVDGSKRDGVDADWSVLLCDVLQELLEAEGRHNKVMAAKAAEIAALRSEEARGTIYFCVRTCDIHTQLFFQRQAWESQGKRRGHRSSVFAGEVSDAHKGATSLMANKGLVQKLEEVSGLSPIYNH